MKKLLERLESLYEGVRVDNSLRRLIERLELLENKDHMIKKLGALSASEKDTVIKFFKQKPNLEQKIDWNNKKLKFADFSDVMSVTKTEREKKVKKSGISGLSKNKDYVPLITMAGVMAAYIPLNWEASILIASNKIGGAVGKWCTAYQKDSSYWNQYVNGSRLTPIYFVGDKDKYALMLSGLSFESLWDMHDKRLSMAKVTELGFEDVNEYNSFIIANRSGISKAQKILYENSFLSWCDNAIEKGSVKVKGAKYSGGFDIEAFRWKDGTWEGGTWKGGTWEGGIWKKGEWLGGTWEDGMWKDGTWEDGSWEDGSWNGGIWKDGIWEDGGWYGGTFHGGTWNDGIWKDGTWVGGGWYGGTWENGHWKDGNWKDGTWKDGAWRNGFWHDGTWHDGTWHNGLWKRGTWLGGVWKRGTWEGGKDKNGNFHAAGDSPDKW